MIWGNWYGVPLPSAKIAVDVFMIISGYLMAANALSRQQAEPLNKARNWLRFWLRRYFRLAPAYYLSLACAIGLGGTFLGGYQALQNLNPSQWPPGGVYDPVRIEYTATNIWLHLSFLFGLHPSYSFSTFLPDWSLSLEMQFYFIFPALYLLMLRFGFLRIAMLLGPTTFILGWWLSKHVNFHEPSLLVMKLNYFLAGILLFRFLQAATKGRRVLTALAALLLVSMDIRYRSQLLVLPLFMSAMLVFAWWESRRCLPRWAVWLLSCRLTHMASDASYGVYLFHGFFISASGLLLAQSPGLQALPPPVRVLAMLIFVTILASVTSLLVFRWVEQPGIRLGRWIVRSKPLMPAAADQPAA